MSSQVLAADCCFVETLCPRPHARGRVLPIRMFGSPDDCRNRIIETSSNLVVAEFLVPGTCKIFSGHYPGFPLLPGVFLIEAALQAVEMAHCLSAGSPGVLCHLSKIQLIQAIVPEQWVKVETSLVQAAGELTESIWRARLSVNGTRVASCILTFGFGLTPAAGATRAALSIIQGAGLLTPAQIATRLAHRPPILLVDGACRAEDGQSLRAHKAISFNEPCYRSLAVDVAGLCLNYPQTLIIESFVQSAGLLLLPSETVDTPEDLPLMIFGGLGACSFHGHAVPGETLSHEVHLTRRVGDMAVLDGSTFCDGRVLAQFSGLIVALKNRQDLVTRPVSSKTPRSD